MLDNRLSSDFEWFILYTSRSQPIPETIPRDFKMIAGATILAILTKLITQGQACEKPFLVRYSMMTLIFMFSFARRRTGSKIKLWSRLVSG